MSGTAAATGPPGCFAQITGLPVHYVDFKPQAGSETAGPPVLMVHGKNGSVYDYLLSPLFPRVVERRRVIVMDRMGCGFSRQPEDATVTVEQQAEIAHALLEHLGVERPVSVGHSLGASVALAHALAHPGGAAGYVLIAPIAFSMPALDRAAPFVRRRAVSSMVRSILLGNSRLTMRRLVDLAFMPNLDCIPDGFTETVTGLLADPCQFQADLRNLMTANESLHHMEQRYVEIAEPIAILAGTADLFSRPEAQARRLARALPRSELELLSGVGHMLQFVEPEAVMRAIEGLARIPAGHGERRLPTRRWSSWAIV